MSGRHIAAYIGPRIFVGLPFILLAIGGCNSAPGRPRPNSEVLPPSKILDFAFLYARNCAGCHGPDGAGGAAIALANPSYLGFADDAVIRRVTANGVAGTMMPAFAQSAGGELTSQQIDAIVDGIRERWSKQGVLSDTRPPPYASSTPGDASRGSAVYLTYCASCHGPNGKGGPRASSIVDGAFLSLISDQELRSIVILGRPELGAPDWRGNVPGRPMSPQEVTDVVSWLSAQRPRLASSFYGSAPLQEGAVR